MFDYGEFTTRNIGFVTEAEQARLRGATKIRLKVYPTNTAAVALYRRLGYTFSGEEAGQLVGYCTL